MLCRKVPLQSSAAASSNTLPFCSGYVWEARHLLMPLRILVLALLFSSLLDCMSAELSHSVLPITAFVVIPLSRAHVEHIKLAKNTIICTN